MANLDDEVRKLKREAAIRQKEEEYQKRREEEEERKRNELERLTKECEEMEAKKRADKMGMLQKQARMRAQKKSNDELLNQKRARNIKQREDKWRKDANSAIQQIVADKEAWDEKVEERLDAARGRKHNKWQAAMEAKQEAELVQEEIDNKRNDVIADRLLKWQIREALRTDKIKEESQAELLSFIQTPFPVPLKQVLCGKIRPVPACTDLLAAHLDAKEEFEDLKAQDFEMRAVLRNQSLFQYVHDIQQQAEGNRIRPPEPAASDLMKKTTRSPRSPKGGKSKGGTSPSRSTGGGFRNKMKR